MTHYACLWRHHESADGTWGACVTGDGYGALSLELPWRDNRENVSCIPYGRYVCSWEYSNHFKRKTYLLEGVHNRKGVRIHTANRIGELRGCIALGNELFRPTEPNGPFAIFDSKSAVDGLADHFNREPFVLEVTWEEPYTYTGKYWRSLVPPALSRLLEIHEYATGGVRSETLCEINMDAYNESQNS
jgi:hypothetical protein